MTSEQVITIIVAVLGSSVISSLISIFLPDFLKDRQRGKEIYGYLQFHLARLSSVVKKSDSIAKGKNSDGILDHASLKNQKEAMGKIYKILGGNFQYIKINHRTAASEFIDAYNDQSSQRPQKLVNAIERLQKTVGQKR